MKKLFLGILSLGAIVFMACSGNASNNASESEIKEDTTLLAQATTSESADYKIVDGKIMPVNNRPMLVDFSATWCPPCRQLKPIFEALKEEYKGKIDFVTIDVDEQPSLSTTYGVQSIPTILYINPSGDVLSRTIGFHSREELKADISQQFNL